jgi:hypothetical protein
MFFGGRVGMPVKVHVGVVLVQVGVFSRNARVGGGEFFAEPFHRAGKIEHAEQNQHQADGKFHGQADAHWNYEAKENDAGADGDDGERVAATPENADESGFGNGALAADDGGDGDHVIGVGGMAHAQEKADGQNGESAGQDGIPISKNCREQHI